jgi:transcription antitermination factor NusG
MTRFWLAFTTPPQKERAAEEDLRDVGFRVRVPMVERARVIRGKRSMVSVPALRGYVFVEFCQLFGQFENRIHAVVSSKYVHRVVGFNGRPGQIAEQVMADFVSKLEAEPMAIEPQFQLREGAHVRIKRGAFAELPGIIRGIEGSSARVLVELFGRSCETKVSLIQLEELDTGLLKTSSREKRRLQGARKSGTLHVG